MTKKSTVKIMHRVYIGDPRDMAAVEDGSVRLVVTSLPYPDAMMEEGAGGKFDFGAYVLDLAMVWRDSFRALAPGCRLCAHLRGGAGKFFLDLDGRPRSAVEAVYSACHAAGFEFDSRIVWCREEEKGIAFQMPGGTVLPRELPLKGEADCVMIFRKPGDAPEAPAGEKQKSRLSKKEAGRIGSVMWSFPDPSKDGFPEEVPKRLIKIYSFVGETVLDPFTGGGAVSVAARDLGRCSIAYSHEADREDEIRKRVSGGQGAKNFKIEQAAPADENKIEKLAAELGKLLSISTHGAAARRPSAHVRKPAMPQKKSAGQGAPRKAAEKKPAAPAVEHVQVVQVFNVNHVRDEKGRDLKLLGIGVPEGFFSRNLGVYRQAMDCVKRGTEGKTVRVKSGGGNSNAMYIFEDGEKTSLNEKLIKSGYALSDKTDHELRKKFDRLEKEAQAHDMGMWALKKTDKPR